MVLRTHRWGAGEAPSVVCVHGVAQHGGVFAELGKRLAAVGYAVTAVDLRGHGESGREPPWNIQTHVADLLETVEGLGIGRAAWIGHSFGGRLAAEVAAAHPECVDSLALLDSGLVVPPDRALRGAELERLDWSFATADGAINAVLANDAVVAAPREVVAAYVRDDVRKGPDGRFRFRFCPSAVVVAWSEMTLPPPPPLENLPMLLVRAEVPLFDAGAEGRRHFERLGDDLTVVDVPNGHNVLWESPEETALAVERFLAGPASAAE